MLESLPEVTGPWKLFLGTIFIVALIFATAWLVRRFGGERLAGAAARGRQPRLGVVDQIDMDTRRKLVIVRRDNVEHLVMIGGPTDVVVEQNIVRAAARDKADPTLGRNLSVSETLSRPVPLGEGTPFPLQPESNGRAARPLPDEQVQWTWPPHNEAPAQSPARAEPRLDKIEPAPKPAESLPVTPREPSFARAVTPPPAARPAPTPPAPAAATTTPAEKVEKPAPIATPEDNLAEMATRLEASFRRPPEPRAAETPAPLKAEPVVPPALRADPEQRPAPPEPKPEAPAKGAFESLEEEMASLLGRPPGKT